MQPVNANVTGLSPDQQELLARWLREFEHTWEEGALARRATDLPPDGPLRRAALLGLVKIDLRRSWQQGRKRPLEAYLGAFPDLGPADALPIDLIQAEMLARKQAGDPVSVADLARRFPQQMGQLQRGLQRMCEDPTGKTVTPSVHATTTGASASATAHGKITETAHGLPPEPPPSPFAEQMSTAGTIRPPARPPVATGLEPPPAAAPPRAGAARPADESVAGELHTIRPGESEPEIDLSEVTRKAPTSTSRYHILRELGRGAMGTVYLAQDTHLQRQVAMKVPHFRPGDGPEMLARFYREARSAGTLEHPNICPVYDVGENAGIPYLTMAFIEGTPLTDVMRRERPMDPHRAADIVHRLARGLEEAHRHGIIHRDLKPSNVMMNRRGEPVVMDFGLARRLNQDTGLTQQGSVLGTPAYMPPEQVHGDIESIGPASDIYSLGVILYELLTGQVPFQGSMGQVMAKIVTETPPAPTELRPGLDPKLEQICLRAMAPLIHDRFPSMGEFAQALGSYLQVGSKSPKSSPDVIIEGARPDPDLRTDTVSIPPAEGKGKAIVTTRRSRRVLAFAVAAAILAILGAVGYFVATVILQPEPATVAVQTDPAGAAVFVNDRPQDRQPDGSFKIAPGTYDLRLELKGYETRRERLVVRAGDAGKPLHFKLTPSAAANGGGKDPVLVEIEIASKPAGAQITLNGDQRAEKTPAKIALRPGTYVVGLHLEGYEPGKGKITVGEGAAPKFEPVVLERHRGTVKVETTPPGANVVVKTSDGKQVHLAKDAGLTPTDITLPVGEYTFDLLLKGYTPSHVTIKVRRGEQKLAPTPVVLSPEPKEKYALLVGVNRPGNELPDFIHAEADVAELGRLLVAGGYPAKNVVVLTKTLGEKAPDVRPTAARIRAALQGITKKCGSGDSVLVVLVGHAIQPDKGGPSHFCPVEAVLNNEDKLVSLAAVYDQLDRCPARSKLLVLDCWRKDLRKEPPAPPRELPATRPADLGLPTKSVSVLVSCSARELGYEHPDRRHGAFTASLLRGLLKPGGGTADDLAKAVRTEVTAVVAADYNATQTPELLAANPPAARPELTLDGVLAEYLQGSDHLERSSRARSAREKAAEAQRAIDALGRAADAAPKDAPFLTDVYARRAEAYWHKGQYPAMAADCERALKIDPRNATANSHLAEALSEQEKYEDAQAYHQRAINADPDYAQAYFARGRTHHLANELNLALNEYEHALNLNPRLRWAHANLGFVRLSQPKPAVELAIKSLSAAIALDPDFTRALYGRGIAYTMKKQFKPAITDLSRAIRLSEEAPDADYYEWRARAYAGDGQPMQAAKDRAKAKEIRGK